MKLKNIVLILVLLFGTRICFAQVVIPSIISSIGSVISAGSWFNTGDTKLYYVEVESQGHTVEEAKQNGFKIAVKQAMGTLVLNEVEVANQNIIRNDVIMYSSGMVEKYKIKNQSSNNSQVVLVMDVWVSDSRIANRLMTIGKGDAVIAGDQIAAREQSHLAEQLDGDRVISTVVNDFPKRAFEVKIKNTQIQRQNRNFQIIVNVNLEWSKYYLDSLVDALNRTKSGTPSFFKNYDSIISVKNPKLFGEPYQAGFNDGEKKNILQSRFIDSDTAVQVTAVGNNSKDVLIQNCYSIPDTMNALIENPKFGNTLNIRGDRSFDFELALDDRFNKIEKVKRVEVKMVPGNECRNI
jgi:hypothetical protein